MFWDGAVNEGAGGVWGERGMEARRTLRARYSQADLFLRARYFFF